MQTVFEASNNVEAHMIVHLLDRAGISAEIMGEHLQGGVGELPAHGNIRVVVDPQHASEAREIISAWEIEQPAVPPMQTAESRGSIYSGLVYLVVGAGIASAFLLWAYNSPVNTHIADYNRDGKPDEWVYWRGETVSRVEMDRNHDGEVDAQYIYSPRNSLEKGKFDNDFDGTFEYVSEYKYANPHLDEIDANGDGQSDYRYHYVDGVLTKVDMFRPSTRIVKKSQTYVNGVTLIEAQWDSDNDGVLDTLIKYGPFEEELSRSPIPRDH